MIETLDSMFLSLLLRFVSELKSTQCLTTTTTLKKLENAVLKENASKTDKTLAADKDAATRRNQDDKSVTILKTTIECNLPKCRNIQYDEVSGSENKTNKRATKNAHVVTTLEETERDSFEDCSTQQMNVPQSLRL